MTETAGMFDNFIHPCLTCGTTVHVVSGQTQPHECHDLPAADQPAYAWWQGYDAAKAHDTVAKKAKAEALREYADDLEANSSAETWDWSDFVSDAREYASLYDPPRQNTPVSTTSGPSSGLEGQDATQETQDATEAAQRRVERYAEEFWRALRIAEGEAAARVAIAVADQEQAELRAEVERLRKPTVAAVMGYELGAGDLEHAEARVAELEATVREALSTFAHPTHPGRECRQSGHVPIETLRRWQAILDAPKDTTAP